MALSKKKPYGLINPYDLDQPGLESMRFDSRTYPERGPSIKSPVDMNLDLSMPDRDNVAGASGRLGVSELDGIGASGRPGVSSTASNSDVKKPVGMLSRIKDFVSGQVGQFAAEQTGTEAEGSSTGMGRVLRALAGAGTVAAIGGQPAVQLATGVAGTVRNLARDKAQKKLDAAKLMRDAEDRALKTRNTESEIRTREQKASNEYQKTMYDRVRAALSSGADFLGLSPSSQERAMRIKKMQAEIEKMGRPDKLKDPKEVKPLENPDLEFSSVDGVETPRIDSFNSKLSTRIVSTIKGKLLNEKVKDPATGKEISKWEAASTPGITRQMAKAMMETDPEFRKLLLDEKQIEAEAEKVTQLRHAGAMTKEQYANKTADQINSGMSFKDKWTENLSALAQDMSAPKRNAPYNPRAFMPPRKELNPKNWKF